MPDAPSPAAQPPDCERCGTRTLAARRQMRTHQITSGQAIPEDRTVDTWRCPRCGREVPRD